MPAWKRVIVSGSDATLTSVTATAGFTGSLFGTASFAVSASRAVTSSFALTSSFVTGSILTSANPARFATQFQVLPSSSAALNIDTTLSKFYPILVPVRNDGNNSSALAYYNSGSFSYDFGTNTLTVTSSRAVTASFVTGSIFTSTNPALTASFAISSSRAATSSFALSAPATTPGGSNGQLQYNNNGVFDGISNTSWNGTTISGLHTTNGTFLQAIITPRQSDANIDISSFSYTLPGAGTYRITQANPTFGTTDILFPDPANYDLQQIIIINADTTNDAAINATYQPILADGTALGSLVMATPYIFVSIGGNWYLISSS